MLEFDSPMLKVRVGSGLNTASFFVHPTLITSRSDFFKHATSQDSKENEETTVALPEDNPVTFRRYLNLIYAHQLATKRDMQWLIFCRLYVLAEKLQDVTSKNQIIDGMCVFFNENICPAVKHMVHFILPAVATAKLYDGTTHASKARKLLVDLYTDFGSEIWLRNDELIPLPEEFIHELAVRLFEKRGPVFSDFRNSCPSYKYHDVRGSPPEVTPTGTGEVEPVLADERSDAAQALTVTKKEPDEDVCEPKDIKEETKRESSDVAAD
ncbi:hypothetical protein J4E93_000511 [Alternaria ventricosa]|uniref:uncharacterized protein n=1 Tax=Alternaria ventricosa TaxID=1187951 RepID=UPI0020C36F67|nr:uncharacterized protein J4E93_000511 [Alternaria ventricosa]KAI4655796.1 hypothetical protein J4E93_000511 [Alternaria ventricosa]